MVFNPLKHLAETAEAEQLASESNDENLESTSALINDTMGMCPKCKQPFGSATVDNTAIYYCEPCRVSQPLQA